MRTEIDLVLIGTTGNQHNLVVVADITLQSGEVSVDHIQNIDEISSITGLSSGQIWEEVSYGFRETESEWLDKLENYYMTLSPQGGPGNG